MSIQRWDLDQVREEMKASDDGYYVAHKDHLDALDKKEEEMLDFYDWFLNKDKEFIHMAPAFEFWKKEVEGK